VRLAAVAVAAGVYATALSVITNMMNSGATFANLGDIKCNPHFVSFARISDCPIVIKGFRIFGS
jgi:hypothetical protein